MKKPKDFRDERVCSADGDRYPLTSPEDRENDPADVYAEKIRRLVEGTLTLSSIIDQQHA